MAPAINNPSQGEERKSQWIAAVDTLLNQMEAWSVSQGWAVARETKLIHERNSGDYQVPLLRVRLSGGEIHVNPIGFNVIGADGRIDIEAFPSLNRVKLISRQGRWEIYT